ncbi:MAG: alpha/beta hydrolase [Dokdonella sp.]|uniref:alpha/beta hydrolase n=1 Tax=Dokdonella sp. TaxID=2291710 RepID=UPI00326636F0
MSRFFCQMPRWAAAVVGLALMVSSSADAGQPSTAVISDPAYATPQALVDIDHGRRLNLYCIGTGAPTVVFDAGLANWSQIWGLVQPVVAKTTRACAYDRAGLGFSDPPTRPGSSANIVDDLHRLLTAAAIAPPYVLVGHSYGGMNVRLYASMYRNDVAGLVLDDSSHEEWTARWLVTHPDQRIEMATDDADAVKTAKDCLAAARIGMVPGTAIFARCATSTSNSRYVDAISAVYGRLQQEPGFLQARMWEEHAFDYDSPPQLLMARRPYGDLPMVVLTHAQSDTESGLPDDEGGDLAVQLHGELAALSTRGVQRVVPHAGHDIHFDQPQAVIDAILEVVGVARQSK